MRILKNQGSEAKRIKEVNNFIFLVGLFGIWCVGSVWVWVLWETEVRYI